MGPYMSANRPYKPQNRLKNVFTNLVNNILCGIILIKHILIIFLQVMKLSFFMAFIDTNSLDEYYCIFVVKNI